MGITLLLSTFTRSFLRSHTLPNSRTRHTSPYSYPHLLAAFFVHTPFQTPEPGTHHLILIHIYSQFSSFTHPSKLPNQALQLFCRLYHLRSIVGKMQLTQNPFPIPLPSHFHSH